MAFRVTIKRLTVFFCMFSSLHGEVRADQFVVGMVPQFETRKLHQIWSPVWNYLAKETGHEFVIKGSPTIPEFEKEFQAGEFDFCYMNPYHFVLANQTQGYQPVARDVGRKLHGILAVRSDSDITNPKDLDGAKIAFPAPNALGASLQMRQELVDVFNVNIEPVYVNTHDSVYLNVLLKQTKAGGGVQKTFNRQPENIRSQLKIIHKTKEVSPHPIAVHPRVSPAVKEAVIKALEKYASTQEGAKALALIPMKQLGRATMADYDELRQMGLERFYVAPR